MTINTLWLANLETLTQQLLESAGRIWDGPGILKEIKILPKDHTIDITLIASCARNLVTVQTTVVNQPLSPANPSSPSTYSKIVSRRHSQSKANPDPHARRPTSIHLNPNRRR